MELEVQRHLRSGQTDLQMEVAPVDRESRCRYGDIQPPLDEDEYDFMSLPLKFNVFPKVTVNDITKLR